MECNFLAKVEPSGKDSSISIDGHELPYVRSFIINSEVNMISTVQVEMLAIKPFEVNGRGEIVINTKIVDREIARQVYESLKEIFELERKQ